MEKARAALSVGEEAAELVAQLDVRPHRAGRDASFYEGFALRGIRVDHIHPGFLSCTFRVPARLTVSRLPADAESFDWKCFLFFRSLGLIELIWAMICRTQTEIWRQGPSRTWWMSLEVPSSLLKVSRPRSPSTCPSPTCLLPRSM